jgi:hypothetical protein
LPCPAHGLAAVGRAQLAEDALQVRLYRVDRDVHLRGDALRVEQLADVPQHISFPAAELLDDHRGSAFRCLPLCRDGAWRYQAGTEQLTVRARKLGMACQHRSQPAALHGEQELTFLRLAQR